MLSNDEIINLIKQGMDEIRDINEIPADIPFDEKVILVQARQETFKSLQKILDLAEAKKSTEGKPKKHELL